MIKAICKFCKNIFLFSWITGGICDCGAEYDRAGNPVDSD